MNLGDILNQIGRLVNQRLNHKREPLKTMSVIEQLLQSKQNANKSPYYIRALKFSLIHFARWLVVKRQASQIPFDSITAQEVEDFISQYAMPSTRRTYRANISALFSFGIRRGYIEKNPCNAIEPPVLDRELPRVLKPEQVDAILNACPQEIRPYFILATFVGCRPMELCGPYRRLDWDAVNLESRTVSVIGKRKRRQAPIEDRPFQLLKEHPNRNGPISPPYSKLSRWMRGTAAPLIGETTWPVDISRHTAASMLMSKYQDEGKVSTWLGHSPQILRSHYLNLVSKSDADKFWACKPMESGRQLELQL